ncbi:MAG: DUF5591 domain-containing protein [Thermoplasmata archaeon]|nr:DUF5591 domain-containing protein [Thermoplasmata archaeon]
MERISGLAVCGGASIGPLLLTTPSILFAEPESAESAGPFPVHGLTLRERGASPGERSLIVGGVGGELPLRFPISAPEVSGISGSVEEAAPGCFVVHAPLDHAQWAALATKRPELVVLANARTLFGEGEPFVRFVEELRQRVGPAPLLWAPRVALPHRLPLLIYLGVDLLDTTEGRIRSIRREYLDPDLGTLDESEARSQLRCPCPSCRSDPPGSLAAHAEWLYVDQLSLTKTALLTGRLRELVEARLSAEPVLAELLRYSDRILRQALDERTPVVGSGVRTYILQESHRRPEVLRFRHRFLERYRPPDSKRVLLLVPCSRTKPYRNSRSHRRFSSALEGLRCPERVHTVSVTSPLGLVPRELEDVYPARHYDIPVTGTWDEEERAAVVDAFRHLVHNGPYTDVVVHLDPKEYEFLREHLPTDRRTVWTLQDDSPTRTEAIATLHVALEEATRSLSPVEHGPLTVVREGLQAIAGMQFGPEAARLLFSDPVRLAGRPWFQRVTDGHGVDLATWREERGWFQLTVPGGLRMLSAHPLEVELAEHLELAGDLFTPGVVRADPAIRVGDAVSLVRHGELLGVGEALLPPSFMTGLPRGAAVRVRHRRHAVEAQIAPTPT